MKFFEFFKSKFKKEEDPLSDLKTVSRWMQDLPAGDIYNAHEQVVHSLIQFNHSGLPMTRDRLQVLMHLDEQARDMQFSLCQQYLRNPRMSKLIESRLWAAIHAFYWEITRGYHAFIMDFIAHPGGNKIQPMLPLILARAAHGFGDIFKWRYFRYERIDEKLWLRIHNIYRISEFENLQTQRVKLYNQDSRQSNSQTEYARALLLSPLGSGNLTARQIEMVDHWLLNWAERAKVDRVGGIDRTQFIVDLARGQGMRRARGGTQPEGSFRYLHTQGLLDTIDQTVTALKAGKTPASLGLGEDFRLPDGYDLIQYIRNAWAPDSDNERRGGNRESADNLCEVIPELSNICYRLQLDNAKAAGMQPGAILSPEEILDIKLYGFVTERTRALIAQRRPMSPERHLERWPLRDVSESGVGIHITNDLVDWLRVGRLVAVRVDSQAEWRVGIVRRIERKGENNRNVGVQTFKRPPVLVTLEAVINASNLTYSSDNTAYRGESPLSSCLLLEHPDHGLILVLDSSAYANGRVYRMRSQQAEKSITLGHVLDKGDGWLMAAFN